MTGKIELQPAFVLHTRPFRDTSLLVDFFCLDHGRVRAVARGVRRPAARQKASVQPFIPLLVSLSGRGDLLTLRGMEQSAPALGLKGTRLFSGLYINELLVRLLPLHEACTELFRHYRQALLQLHADAALEPALRRFELMLLQELGYGLDLRMDWRSGQPILAGGWYLFNAERGFELVPDGSLAASAMVFKGGDILAISEYRLELPATAKSAKRLLRLALEAHLGEQPLSSRRLFHRSTHEP